MLLLTPPPIPPPPVDALFSRLDATEPVVANNR